MKLTPRILKKLILETMNEVAFQDFDFPELENSSKLSVKQYGMSAFNTYNLSEDFSLNETEQPQYKFDIYDPTNPDPSILQDFFKGITENKHAEFLSDWKIEDFRDQWLLITKDRDAGVANTKDGHMGAGWNNGSKRGVLRVLMDYCIKNLGGVSGDHFDGGLSGYYRSIGLVEIYEMYTFDPAMAPSKWKYAPVDVLNPKYSAYATALSNQNINADNIYQKTQPVTSELEGFKKTFVPYDTAVRYSNGMPDVIFRRIA
jgi:hypothetical protein